MRDSGLGSRAIIAYNHAMNAWLQRVRSASNKFSGKLAHLHPGRWGMVSGWRLQRLQLILAWIGIAAAIVLAVLAVVLLPPLLSPDLDDPRAQFEVLDRARLTVAAIIGGVGVILGVFINWRRMSALERQVTTLQLGQITERFTRAIDQLGSVRADNEPTPEIRAGGVRSLERIARESADDFWPILDILTAYLRAERRWEPPSPDQDYPTGYNSLPEELMNRMDVAFTVDAIVRLWPHRGETGTSPLNLEYTFVPGISLSEKSLVAANLEGAGLYLAILQGADLQGANFRSTFLRRANLRRANLGNADFWGATLEGALLQGADLRGAFLVGAVLRGAHLQGADLRGVNLSHAKLEHAHLDGAVYDRQTRWPTGFAPPGATE